MDTTAFWCFENDLARIDVPAGQIQIVGDDEEPVRIASELPAMGRRLEDFEELAVVRIPEFGRAARTPAGEQLAVRGEIDGIHVVRAFQFVYELTVSTFRRWTTPLSPRAARSLASTANTARRHGRRLTHALDAFSVRACAVGIGGVVFRSGAKLLAALGDKGVVHLRKVETGELVHELKSPDDVDSIDFAADSKLARRLGFERHDQTLEYARRQAPQILQTTTHRGKFTRDPHRLLIVSHDLDLACWDVDTGKIIFKNTKRQLYPWRRRSSRRKGRGRWRRRCAFKVWSLGDGEQIQHCNASGLCVRRGFFPDGTKLAISARVRWDLEHIDVEADPRF